MKRLAISLICLSLSVGSVWAASEKNDASSKPVKAIKLSVFAGSLPKNTPTGTGLQYFVAKINEYSKGSLAAEAFYDTQLGDATSMVQSLQQGTVDIGVSGTSYYSGLVPEVQVFELPFLFDSIDKARAAVDGPAMDLLFKKLAEKDIVGLCFWENGFRQLSNDVRPVKTPADLKGIKIRTLPSPIQIAAWKELGALPTAIDVAELYTALQQGTVKAQENPLAEIVFRKFYEVQKYVSLTGHVYTPFLLSMSKATYSKLSEEQKAVIFKAAKEARTVQREAAAKMESEARKVLTDNGVKIEDAPDKAAFKKITQSVYTMFTSKYGDSLLKMIQSN